MKFILSFFAIFMAFNPLFADSKCHNLGKELSVCVISLKNSEMSVDILRKNGNKIDSNGILETNKHNVVLIKNKGVITLIDSGFENTTEVLKESLRAQNISTDDINYLLITHPHPDHIGGALENGKKLFKNATMLVHKNDYEAFKDKLDSTFSAYDLDIFEGGAYKQQSLKNLQNIQTILMPGHTPGHSIVVVQGDMDFIFGADIFHILSIQKKDTSIYTKYDSAPKEAIKSRDEFLKLLKNIKKDTIVSGTHLPFLDTKAIDFK